MYIVGLHLVTGHFHQENAHYCKIMGVFFAVTGKKLIDMSNLLMFIVHLSM